MKLSIDSPVYRTENFLNKLISEIRKVMTNPDIDYEILLVDDISMHRICIEKILIRQRIIQFYN